MSRSLAHVLAHIIFSTKNRAGFLQSPDLGSEVHAYLVGTLRGSEENFSRSTALSGRVAFF
ncbi:MAG TPA: hypothetical protein VE860_22095 [Chthoniobacterales bacterium]|nr:hypothetical protein [Chthoniobacterales bacterium]